MSTLDAVLSRIDQDIDASVERLFALLRIASVSTDPAYKEQCRAAAEHVAADLRSIGFEADLRPTEGHPVVVGKANGVAGPRVLFYGHYDVQPVDPLDLWKTPPFEPRIETLPGGRKIIVARGACDDKGQAMTFIEACRAFKAVTGKLPLPITTMIEGEEECGSKHLFNFVRDNADEFKLDLALVCDTAMWNAETPAVTTSLRGLVYEEVKITCADRDLHSGLFGGAAQNPLRLLAKILGALWDDNGRVTIPGFYDGVKELPADIKADLKALNLTAEQFLGQVGLKFSAGEKGRLVLEQITTRPTAEINGIVGGYTGEGAKTVIPGEAMAKVSFRPGGRAGPGENPRRLPRLRARAAAGRLQGRIRQFRPGAGAAIVVRQSGADQGAHGAGRGVGQQGGGRGCRRLDPDRGGLQARAGHGFTAGRLRARRRPRAFAEREVRPQMLPQGHPQLGAHPAGAVG